MTTTAALPAGREQGRTARRRDLGAFYTPAHVADFMISRLRGMDAGSRILEPSGGDGVFVSALLEHGATAANIDVWDLDASVEPAMAQLGVRFTCRDSLLTAPDEPVFTHVVGNPPYLNKQSTYVCTNRAALRRQYSAIGLSDTYAMFGAMALRQVVPGGQVSLLVSDTFLTLGIHRKMRELLCANVTLDEIVLLPDGLFDDAKVSTAVITITNAPAPEGHTVTFWDLSATPPGTYTGGASYDVPQAELASNPGATFAYTPAARRAMSLLAAAPAKLTDVTDGGLGMYTRDNLTHLRVVDHPGLGTLAPVPAEQDPLPSAAVDGVSWRAYHKRGGTRRWWGPAEHAVAWDERSRAKYGIPATCRAGANDDGTPRQGIVISGVADRFTARLATPGAMWESNKCFALFPKDPSTLDAYALLAVLNSSLYAQLAAALNHTVSLQWRDVDTLPWFDYSDAELTELASLAASAVEHVRTGQRGTPTGQVRIDAIVEQAAARCRFRTAPATH